MTSSLSLPCPERVRMRGRPTLTLPRPKCHFGQWCALCLICNMTRGRDPPGVAALLSAAPCRPTGVPAGILYLSAAFISSLIISLRMGSSKHTSVRTLTHYIAHNQLHAPFFHQAVRLTASQSCSHVRLCLSQGRHEDERLQTGEGKAREDFDGIEGSKAGYQVLLPVLSCCNLPTPPLLLQKWLVLDP